jgi:putative tryptophan/tyrosine transport system substrate-binding protein
MQGLIINTALNTIRLIKNNLTVFLVFLALSITSTTICATNAPAATLPTVAITQIVQHGSLDEEYKGIVDALKEAGYEDGKTIHLIYQNAQGNLATANLIASNFASKKPIVGVGISTPSAQSLLMPLREQNIPLVFTAVTDPLSAGLVTSYEKRNEAVTGISDALLPGPQLDLIKKFIPAVKTIGIVYNPGETNSVKAVSQLQDEAKKQGLILILAMADKSSDVIAATNNLIGKVDAIYIPNDNTAVAAIESIVGIGKKHKVPVFAGDAGSVERGAVAAHAYDRFALGREAGELVVKILRGEKAGDLTIALEHPLVLMINVKSAEEMGITIPDALKDNAKLIGDKS